MQAIIHKYKKAAPRKKETEGDQMAKKPLYVRYAEIRALRRKLIETERFYPTASRLTLSECARSATGQPAPNKRQRAEVSHPR
jgi:hypothetical protein